MKSNLEARFDPPLLPESSKSENGPSDLTRRGLTCCSNGV